MLITLNRRTSVAPVIWRALKVIFLNVVHTAKCNRIAYKDGILHIGQYGSYISKPTAIAVMSRENIHCTKPVLLSDSVRGLPVTLWKSTCKLKQKKSVYHLVNLCDILQCNALFPEHSSENFRHELERKR